MEVYDLGKGRLSFSAQSALGPSAALTFNPAGELLAVGTEEGWQIWAVQSKQVLAQKTGTPVYAVAFSPDDRLFAWGDANGVAHLWGIPEK